MINFFERLKEFHHNLEHPEQINEIYPLTHPDYVIQNNLDNSITMDFSNFNNSNNSNLKGVKNDSSI